jgi:hypothetical protein
VFRSRAPRSVVAAALSIALIAAFMVGTTSASRLPSSGGAAAAAAKPKATPTPPAPTPTPTPTPVPTPTPDTNRDVYFGDPGTDPDGNLQLDPSAVTTNQIFVFDVIARNDDNQTLTHPSLAFGAGAEPDGPTENGLPAGAKIKTVVIDSEGEQCLAGSGVVPASGLGYVCNLPNFASGDFVKATFTVQAGPAVFPANNQAVLWTSFKVAEKVSDQGANQNTAYAQALMTILATGSNANGTFLGDVPLSLETGTTPPTGDTQVTKLDVPGAKGGVISIFETNNPTGCFPSCIGQEVSANVRDGENFQPSYLRWTLDITGIGAGINKGGIIHILDNGDVVPLVYTNANVCSSEADVECFDAYVVNKKTNSTHIVFRTMTNGRVKAG